MKNTGSKFQKPLWLFILFVFFTSPNLSAQDGEALFSANCAMCHTTTNAKLVGPGLGKVNDKRTQDWLIKFIQSSQSLINSGDADAIAIYEEYNKTMMPDQNLADADVIAILDYLKAQGELLSDIPEEATASNELPTLTATREEIKAGRLLFTGKTRLANGGPSCITCHSVNNNAVPTGGSLAKDLSESFANMGAAGVSAIVKSPSFPVMAKAYENRALTDEEVTTLTNYLHYISTETANQSPYNYIGWGIVFGICGFFVLMIVAMFVWGGRKKRSVNHDIYSRQLQSR